MEKFDVPDLQNAIAIHTQKPNNWRKRKQIEFHSHNPHFISENG